MNLLEAIAREEGFYIPRSRAARNHNPGNIRWTPAPHGFAFLHGAIGPDPQGFAMFPGSADGFGCLRALLRTPGYKGKTVAKTIERYAPASENDTEAYVRNVCKWMGVTPETVIDDHLN